VRAQAGRERPARLRCRTVRMRPVCHCPQTGHTTIVGDIMQQRVLVSSILAGLITALTVPFAGAQTAEAPADQAAADQTPKKKEEAQSFETVTVTGSLIPRAQIETASPVITITAADIARQGFRNVYDALHSLPVATGQIQDNQFTNSFTPGANTVSLLGLDPSFTLVLMNGRPLADYPFLYNSNSNFVDLNTIPSFLIDHIDILTGNQSAIYGSAAIAGVVNVVLKQKVDGVDIDFRAGGYTDGGGAQQRFQIGGGHSWGKLDGLFALELNKQNPVFGYQRSYTDDLADDPALNGAPPIAQRDRLELDPFTNTYVDPGKETCDAINTLNRGNESYRFRPNRGYYCGSTNNVGFTSFLNSEKSANGYASLKYALNDSAQLYADGLFDVRRVTYLVGGTSFWATGPFSNTPTYIYDLDSGHLVTIQHLYAPEELAHEADQTVLEHSYVVNFGVRGVFGDSNWNYDAYYHRSGYDADSKARRLLNAEAAAFYLGPQDGNDPYGYGYPAYHIRQQGNFWGATTPQQFVSISDVNRSNSSTYTQVANATITNTDVFQLPAGSAGFAGVVEFGNQYWDNPVDPRITNGEFFGSGGTTGRGKRDRQAAAAELNVPVFSKLTADVSARYDRYSVSGSSQSKITYKTGLEFRPVDTLLLRANYSTAFRAPDMGYVFSGGSISFVTVDDVYNCRIAQGDNYQVCNPPFAQNNIQNTTTPNHDLKYITAKSWGYGVVWSPLPTLSTKVDYYHVKIDNEVATYSVNTIIAREADCRLGHTVTGMPVDINSQICQQTLAEVSRNPPDAPIGAGLLNGITTFPLNLANETVSGITANVQYRLDAGRWGDFIFGADYNTTLKHVAQQFPTDPIDDLLRDRNYYGPFKSIASGNITWRIGGWSTTVYGIRYGKTFSHNGLFTVAPWMIYNASVQYNFNDDAAITLIGNNIFNSRPPKDSSFGGQANYPFYNIFNYNSYGRLVMLEFNMHFGGKP
jgi:outer membrane receptor protein involved in Fe transport